MQEVKNKKEILRKGKFVEMETRLMFEWGGEAQWGLTVMARKFIKNH